MDPFKRKPSVELLTMKRKVMLAWLKKCVNNLHSVTAIFLLMHLDQDMMNTFDCPCVLWFIFPNHIVDDLLILSTEGFHRGTIWLKVENLAALSTNLPTLCQKICHENALYRPQIWVIRHWTTPMGRGSDWAISSAKNQRPVSVIQVTASYSPRSFSHDSQLDSCAIKTSNDFPITLPAPVAWVAFVS